MSQNLLAIRTVKRHALSESDEQWLLDLLGLVAEDGSVPPDDTREYTSYDPTGKGPGVRNRNMTTPPKPQAKGMTTPPGLANLPPVEEVPEPKKVRKPRPTPPPRKLQPCGTYAAYSRHRREGMTLEELRATDDVCYQASLAYGRETHAKYRAKKKRQEAAR